MTKIFIGIILAIFSTTVSAQVDEIAKARKMLSEKDMAGATQILSNLIERHKTSARFEPGEEDNLYRAYSMRANIYSRSGKFMLAVSDLDKAVQMRPKEFDALMRRARFKMMLRDYRGSIADFDMAIENGVEGEKAFVGRALVKRFSGDSEGALADYRLAVSVRAHSAVANIGVASMLKKKDRSAAITYLQAYLDKMEKDWDNQFPNYKLRPSGRLQFSRSGTEKKSNEYLISTSETVSGRIPKSKTKAAEFAQILMIAAGYEHLATMYEESGNLLKALKCIEKSIKLDPSSGISFHTRGRLRARRGDYPGGNH